MKKIMIVFAVFTAIIFSVYQMVLKPSELSIPKDDTDAMFFCDLISRISMVAIDPAPDGEPKKLYDTVIAAYIKKYNPNTVSVGTLLDQKNNRDSVEARIFSALDFDQSLLAVRHIDKQENSLLHKEVDEWIKDIEKYSMLEKSFSSCKALYL